MFSSERIINEPTTLFRRRHLPVRARLAGYSALIERFGLSVPLHHEMSAVADRNTRRKEGGWAIYPAASRPDTVIDHLIFALKNEGVQPLTLKKTFEAFRPEDLERAAVARPTSGYIRRLCHLYEWLTAKPLRLPDVGAGVYVDLIDSRQQYVTTAGERVRRFRVAHNLPGTRSFSPIVFRTRRLEAFLAQKLSAQARKVVESTPRDLVARAAAFLLLADSKASFAIEGENPSRQRVALWSAAVGRAGSWKIGREELVDLQRQLIGDDRFVKLGLRTSGGFVGRHDAMMQPIPEHVSAKAEDLVDLLDGLVNFAARAKSLGFDEVLTAACIAFGFVYIHPFEDGNGRIHRFLMHHVLADRGFTPAEIVFPISGVILDDVVTYKQVLETVSRPLLEWIDWRATADGNIDVLNETADFYRYFDATALCEFLFACIERSIEKALPEELGFLEHRDAFHRGMADIVDMSERKIDLLLQFLKQGYGTLSKRARTGEFAALREDEVQTIQALYGGLFVSNP